MLHNGQEALVVDPGDARVVLQTLERESLRLQSILVTHHHPDHTAGVDALRQATQATVYGPATEDVPTPFVRLREGDLVHSLGMKIEVLDVPGHTAGHIAYFACRPHQPPLIFSGDTLFSAGCGRLFEGTPSQMLDSLNKLAALPQNTQVCCAHEYTLNNLRFARAVDPENIDLIAHETACVQLRAQGQPTLPSTIALERRINPFLRTHTTAVCRNVQAHDPDGVAHRGVFASLRLWKNTFQ